jgi:hypothetical protein
MEGTELMSADTALNAEYSTTATLNFAREDGADGVWSNANAGLTKQSLNSVSVAIRDARTHPTPLEEEGFVLVRVPSMPSLMRSRQLPIENVSPPSPRLASTAPTNAHGG